MSSSDSAFNSSLIAELRSEIKMLREENQELRLKLEQPCLHCRPVERPPVSFVCTEINPKIHRVLKRVLEFLTWSELRVIFILCKDIYKHLHCEEFYIQLCKEKLKYTTPAELTTENLSTMFNQLTGLNASSHAEIYTIMKNTYNFIKNPDARDNFEKWQKSSGYGREITIEEDWCCFKDKRKIFCTSFEWCSLTQSFTIPFSAKQKRLLIVGLIASRRFDCGARAVLRVTINGAETKVESELDDFVAPRFNLLSYKKEIERELVKVKVNCEGKDKKWWAGNYGARFGFCFAYAFDI
jgi:hypothetical protein